MNFIQKGDIVELIIPHSTDWVLHEYIPMGVKLPFFLITILGELK